MKSKLGLFFYLWTNLTYIIIFFSSRHFEEKAVAANHGTPEAEDEGSYADLGFHHWLQGNEGLCPQ